MLIMFSGVNRIPACDGRTDILQQHSPRYAYASRGNNDRNIMAYFLVFLTLLGFSVEKPASLRVAFVRLPQHVNMNGA